MVVKCDCTNEIARAVLYPMVYFHSMYTFLPLSSGYLPKGCNETASSAIRNDSPKILEFINVIVGNLFLSEQPN